MSVRKFRGDKFFDGYRFLENNPVLITSDEGRIIGIEDSSNAGDDVEKLRGILSPGFINCHCHLELSHLKGKIPEGTGLVDFVITLMGSRQAELGEILDAIANAEAGMLANGIVAVGDICNTTHTVLQKQGANLYYHNFIEVSGVNDAVADTRFRQALAVYEEFARLSNTPALSNSLVPHSPYSVSEKLWSMLVGFPGNSLYSVHNQETPEENEWFMNKQGGLIKLFEQLNIDTAPFIAPGKSSLQSFLSRFLPQQEILLVHNVATGTDDITIAEKRGRVNWCICINANKYISRSLPPLPLLREKGHNIVLGTDSLASNHSLSILDEILSIQQSFPGIPHEEILRWATSNGARALNISGKFGSFEEGKQPGVIAIDEEKITSVKF